MDLDAAKPKAAFTPGAQKIETWSGLDPKRGRYQKADVPKVHRSNKSDKPRRGCYDDIFPEILPLVNSKYWFLKHLPGTCPRRSA